ncbi:MAG: FAD-dependent oxidoreductase [Rhodobacteraceae bacterium]|jgi:fumarate reductase flavoprotein subunit|nr:FAD-dependent oxidoreductase [Paracoccaceae bacterium]
MAITRETTKPEFEVDVAIVGGGACGLCAALAATEAGASVLVLERDRRPTGSTALSTGLIPAAGTRLQRDEGIEDDAETFAQDILGKAKGRTDAAMARRIAAGSGPTIDWLQQRHGLAFRLVKGFLYPGHSRLRMHGVPNRTGTELQDALLAAAGRAGIDILTEARVADLNADADGRITALGFERSDGRRERVGTRAVILACNGFGGAPDLLARHIPEMVGAEYFGHAGNTGDALIWGEELGAATADLGAYQGHGAVAVPYGRPMVWALITEGGFQVNRAGERFSNEASGYSEQAVEVIAQPGREAFEIFDSLREAPALDFADYREVLGLGGVKQAGTLAELAGLLGLPLAALERTAREVDEMRSGLRPDPWGRDFRGTAPLAPPYRGVRVTGALFHTQGGLAVDADARVLRSTGAAFPNLFAGGGAARGVSGPSRWGYLSGNGLLTATVLGRLAGSAAAAVAAAARARSTADV